MKSRHSSKVTRRSISSNHSGSIDAQSCEASNIKTRSKNDVLSWEGSSIKTRDNTVYHSPNSKSTTLSDHQRSASQYEASPSTSSVMQTHSSSKIFEGSSNQHITTPKSKATAQLLEQNNVWHKIKEEFPILADYLEEMKLNKQLSQMLTNLFKLKQLPFSPFCWLICQLRPIMERYEYFILCCRLQKLQPCLVYV